MKPGNKPRAGWLLLVAALVLANAASLSAGDALGNAGADKRAQPQLVAAPADTLDALQPGIDAFNEAHAFTREGRQDAEERRAASCYLAHAYLDIIVDMNTWLRFDGAYEQVRSALTACEDEEDVRFVEGKRYAHFPTGAGGDPRLALEMLTGLSGRYELAYYRAIAMLALGDIEGAVEALAGESSLTAAGESLLRRLESPRSHTPVQRERAGRCSTAPRRSKWVHRSRATRRR